jgi:hypothetical protein
MIIELDDHPARCISQHDLGALAEWANKQKHLALDPDFKKCYAMIREGADTLLRKRALATEYLKKGKP